MSGEQEQPILLVVVGPNGSGKSSIFSELLAQYSKINLPFYNSDVVGMTHFSNIDDYEARSRRSLMWCGRRQREHLSRKESFGFETVGANRGAIRQIERAKFLSYHIELLFVSTNDPEINIRRVAERERRGGHGVDPELVVKRYYRVMEMLPQYIELATVATIVDNSPEGEGKARVLLNKNEVDIDVTPAGRVSGWLQKYYLENEADGIMLPAY